MWMQPQAFIPQNLSYKLTYQQNPYSAKQSSHPHVTANAVNLVRTQGELAIPA